LALSLFLQFAAGLVTMILSEQVENVVRSYFSLLIEKYREDPDTQNIIDWGQEEVSFKFLKLITAIHYIQIWARSSILVIMKTKIRSSKTVILKINDQVTQNHFHESFCF